MFIPTGFWKDGLGDIDVIVHNDIVHAFYLSLSSQDRVGHLCSKDGIRWEEMPPAIHTGNPGEFDDDQIWTMGVFAHKGRFFMLYTGLSMKEQGKIQRIGLATSDDLISWVKYKKNPVICADPKWYEAGLDETHRVDWRDPWVCEDNGLLHGVISARSNKGPANRRGCAGHFVSENGYDWKVKPPLCVPGSCYDFETPAVCKIKGRYYLTGISGKNTLCFTPNVFRVAEQIEGPYKRIGHDDLLPGENLVYKPCTWKGQQFYFHNLRGTADWEGGKNCVITSLPPPKVADVDSEGALILRPFKKWDPVAKAKEKILDAVAIKSNVSFQTGKWNKEGGNFHGEMQSGFGAFLLKGNDGSLILTAKINSYDAKEFGFIIRSGDDADEATYVSLTPALRRVQLYTLAPYYKTPSAGVTYRWRGRIVVQEAVSPFDWTSTPELRVLAYGPYLEVSVNDRVLISAITMKRNFGKYGFFIEDGSVDIRSIAVRPLRYSA